MAAFLTPGPSDTVVIGMSDIIIFLGISGGSDTDCRMLSREGNVCVCCIYIYLFSFQ